MKKILLAAALASLFLAGCATTPVPASEAKPADQSRVLAYQEDSESAGTLTIVRDSGFLTAGGCYYAVFINQVLAARLDTGEKASFKVPAGDVTLKASRDPQGKGLCSLDQSTWMQRETSLKPGERKAFRLYIDGAGRPDLARAD
jgi:hypothetical protein